MLVEFSSLINKEGLMPYPKIGLIAVVLFCFWALGSLIATSTAPQENPELDVRVKKFLDKHSQQWRDMNIPPVDGQLLYDLILKNNYRQALEIGTSTGHSGVWMAWALSKSGGKLITIEIDESRYREAQANFREAGLEKFIDARLADAHQLVNTLPGPFDFVFSDADKEWYKNYFVAVAPKLKDGGCFTAHNVRPSRPGGSRGMGGGTQEFLDYVQSLPGYETTVNTAGGGVSISYKKAGK
jgi:caffeoyl-CoA O-methyltransferase